MLGLFIASMSIVLVFSLARLAVGVYFHAMKVVYYKSIVVDILDYVCIVMYIIMAIMLAVSLEIAGVYGKGEVNLTVISLAVVGGMFTLERAYKMYMNRNMLGVRSAAFDLKAMSKRAEFESLLNVSMNEITIDKSKFDEFDLLISGDCYSEYSLNVTKTWINKVAVLLIPVVIAIAILTAGVVLAA